MTSKASIDALRAQEQEQLQSFVSDLQAQHNEAALPTKAKKQVLPVAAASSSALVPAAKESYSHEAMVALMVANPHFSHAQLAGHFGRPAVWMSAVLASAAFQDVLDGSRHLIADPSLTASLDERFKALAIRSVTVIGERLNNPAVADLVVLKAAEIGIKALGVGILPPPAALPAPVAAEKSIAEKLLEALDARDSRRTVLNGGDIQDVTPNED